MGSEEAHSLLGSFLLTFGLDCCTLLLGQEKLLPMTTLIPFSASASLYSSLCLQMKANSANDWTVIPTALLQCSFIRKSLHPNYRWCSGCREHRSDETTVTAQSFCTDNPGLCWLYSKAVCLHTSSYMKETTLNLPKLISYVAFSTAFRSKLFSSGQSKLYTGPRSEGQ